MLDNTKMLALTGKRAAFS